MPAPTETVRFKALKMVFWQFVVILVLSAVLLLVQGLQSGLSALLGGVAYCLPNLIFAWRVFERTTARAAKQFIVAFMFGEITKLLTSAVLFVLIVKFLPVRVITVLVGYITAIMAFWVVSFITMLQE